MKKFEFAFASVLDLRKRKEKKALVNLAENQQKYQREIENKNKLVEALQDSLARREEIGQRPEALSISIFQAEQDFIQGTKQRIIFSDQAILRARRGLEKSIKEYFLSRTETKSIQTLYDKAQREHRKRVAHYEEKEIQDLLTMRAHLNKEEAS